MTERERNVRKRTTMNDIVSRAMPTLYDVHGVKPMAVSTMHAGTFMERKMSVRKANGDVRRSTTTYYDVLRRA